LIGIGKTGLLDYQNLATGLTWHLEISGKVSR